MLRSGRARAGAHEARTLWIPVDSLDCSPQRRCRVLERPPFLSNSNKGEPGPPGLPGPPGEAAGACSPRVRPHRRAAPATGKCPTDSCCSVYLKALFLRLQKTQPQKSIRAIKKRHKLASPTASRNRSRRPGLALWFCPVLSSKVRLLCPRRRPPRATGVGQSRRKLPLKKKKMSYKMS